MWDHLMSVRTLAPAALALQGRAALVARTPLEPASPSERAVQCRQVARRVAADCIGEELRAHYAALLVEPVPERFVELLRDLDRPNHGFRA